MHQTVRPEATNGGENIMKKLLVGATSVAMLLSTVMPAFAANAAIVKNNDVTVTANSGLNQQMAKTKTTGVAFGGSTANVTGGGVNQGIVTGPAVASGKQAIVANVDLCGCGGGFNLAVVKKNDVDVSANSGLNLQMAKTKSTGVAGLGSTANVTGGGVNQGTVTGPSVASGRQLIVVNVSGL